MRQNVLTTFLFVAMSTMAVSTASAQGTVEDYNRAFSLRQKFSSDSVYHWAHDVAWCKDSYTLYYRISTPEGGRFVSYDASNGTKKVYQSREEMEKALGIKPRPAGKPRFGRLHQRHWMEVDEEQSAYPVASPDGKMEAYIEGYNVVLHEVGKPYSDKRILTQDGTIGCYYSNRIQWSPDGSHIFVCKRVSVEKRYAYYVESSPSDQLQPILHKQEYAKPGDALPQHLPTIINVKTGRKVEADRHQLENQYALTPKSFLSYNWNMTSLAELGFIVVQLDAMGTSWRGKQFEEVCYKNLKDAGFPDRELWIKAAAKKYPYMDADNVGIFGASAGGQESTTAVLLHGDFYKAAYSSCGCHDNRMDKIWWNEQWMSYPIDSSYVECSNVENAHKLERPLMLVVGEMDDNVDPSSTYQVVNALVKADKDFELVVLPGVHHTMGENFGEHKRYDFFVKNLLGVNPPKWSEIKK